MPCTRLDGHTARAAHLAHDFLRLESPVLQCVEIVAEELHAELGPDAGGKHQNAALDRLEKARHAAGHELQRLSELVDEILPGHPATPLAFGLEHDRRLDHLHRRGIGRGIGAAELAGGAPHFGEAFEDAILPGHDALHFAERSGGHERRHEEQAAFIERRHEFAADARGEFCEARNGRELGAQRTRHPNASASAQTTRKPAAVSTNRGRRSAKSSAGS